MKVQTERLGWVCNATFDEIAKWVGMKVETVSGGLRRAFKDNGSNVLAIAHLDTVQPAGKTYGGWIELDTGPFFFNPYLDDRLGAWVISDYLPPRGIVPDILFTEGEETGKSTAAGFVAPRQYNWMFSFDRAGDDVVVYNYGKSWWGTGGDKTGEAWEALIKAAGYTVGWGSFSDICKLEHLGCKALNIGTGLHDGHGPRAYSELRLLAKNVRLFEDFWKAHKDTRFPHTEKPSSCGTSMGFTTGGAYRWGTDLLLDRTNPARLTKKERKALIRLAVRDGDVPRCAQCRNPVVGGKCVICGSSDVFGRAPGSGEKGWCERCKSYVDIEELRGVPHCKICYSKVS